MASRAEQGVAGRAVIGEFDGVQTGLQVYAQIADSGRSAVPGRADAICNAGRDRRRGRGPNIVAAAAEVERARKDLRSVHGQGEVIFIIVLPIKRQIAVDVEIERSGRRRRRPSVNRVGTRARQRRAGVGVGHGSGGSRACDKREGRGAEDRRKGSFHHGHPFQVTDL